ncbi:MAG: galactose-1-phosphate uridylyltransferase [Bifidobacteriaceae bacterium]|jgi:UDPglucose--hexose-1-phosphate uridylyltransferase|nr:galactose-1-phosphate uridylyltransferase [Bifidobacteriaceae bacterium]
MRITPTKLADGRDLIYFDDSEPYASGGATRRLDDPRPLADRTAPFTDPATGATRVPTGPEMRLDRLTGEWIPMASHRMNRTFQPSANACPLCPAQPGSDYQDGEIPDTSYDVVVFENRFPSYWRLPGQDVSEVWQVDGQSLWPARHAAGRCEVICFSPGHTDAVAGVSTTRMRTIVEAWAHRTAFLETQEGIATVYPFENRGPEIGVTLPHPHGQIYAYPALPPKTATMARQAGLYQEATGGNLFADVVRAELDAGTRLLAETGHWVAYVPEAARWPVEVHISPRRDVPSLPELTEVEKQDFAELYPRLLRGLDHFFVDDAGVPMPLPYISGWLQAPVDPSLREPWRLHVQLFSVRRAANKLKYLAGSESGAGAWISDTTPERIADRARQALQEAGEL